MDCGKLAEAEGSSEIAVTGVSPEDINQAERRFKLDYPAGIERAALERLVSFFPKGSFLSLVYVHSFLKCKPPASPQSLVSSSSIPVVNKNSIMHTQLTCADIGMLFEVVHIWPMSSLVFVLTSHYRTKLRRCLNLVRTNLNKCTAQSVPTASIQRHADHDNVYRELVHS